MTWRQTGMLFRVVLLGWLAVAWHAAGSLEARGHPPRLFAPARGVRQEARAPVPGGPVETAESRESSRSVRPSAADPASGFPHYLGLAGIGPDQLGQLTDGTPWRESDEQLMLRILFHLRRLSPRRLEEWTAGRVSGHELAARPGRFRGEVFVVRGQVKEVEALGLSAELRARFEFERYYRCRLAAGPDGRTVLVFALAVPRAWKLGQTMSERGGARAVFLKLASDGSDGSTAVFAAPRVAWYPRNLLGELGMDVGLLDEVPVPEPKGTRLDFDVRRLRLTSRDSEAFYQMLAAVGRARPGQLLRQARRELARSGGERFSVVPLFNEPHRQKGRLVALSGTARHVASVPITDPRVARLVGADRYYEIALFTEDSQRNPLFFCVRRLPAGMPMGEGPRYGETITVAGFFFKTWAYRARLADPDSRAPRWQLAPLLVGRAPLWHRPAESSTPPWLGPVAGALFAVGLVAIWVILWRLGASDRRFRREVLAKHASPEGPPALDELDDEGNKARSPKD